MAEELVKPLLCCMLETLLKVPQPKHGGEQADDLGEKTYIYL
ncbi:hypothetical protein A343_0373 [Porphyromonas gingivalis JCVI SC001]|nr:hypothetical protein A343_0373 [Porphyromonas gingivalis JCVI SC001]